MVKSSSDVITKFSSSIVIEARFGLAIFNLLELAPQEARGTDLLDLIESHSTIATDGQSGELILCLLAFKGVNHEDAETQQPE